MRQVAVLAGLIALLAFPAASFADPINLGLISFDVLIPSGSTSGVNVFNIMNLTGSPAGGGFALPPDFPVLDPIVFLGSSLTVVEGGITTAFALGDLGPGVFPPTTPLEFPSTSSLSLAVFTATLSQTSFLLSDGTTFVAPSSLITATLLPSSGSFLAAGVDFALVNPAPVPEPGTLVLLGSGLAALIGIRMRLKHN